MSASSLGDMARSSQTARQIGDMKQRLFLLTREMSSGQKSDVPRALGADRGRLSAVEHAFGIVSTFRQTGESFARSLDVGQTAINRLDAARQALADALVPQTGTMVAAAQSGEATFFDMVSAINTRIGSQSLFGGVNTDAKPLPDAEVMLSDLRAGLSGAATSAEVMARIDNWFDDPAGGFATMTANTVGAARTSTVAEGVTLAFDVTASDPALKSALKYAAMAALVTDPAVAAVPDAAHDLRREAARGAVATADPVSKMQARLGMVQGRIEQTQSWLAARSTELETQVQDIRGADPFETASALQQLQTQLETQYLLTARLSSLSLVEYLR